MYASTLMAELRNAGCNVVAVCRMQSPLGDFLRSNGVPCRDLPDAKKISPSSIRFLRSTIASERCDNIHVHFHRDIWVASLALRNDTGRKLFASIYMGVTPKNDPFHRWIYKRVDGFFTSSRVLNERLPSLYPVPPGKIHLL